MARDIKSPVHRKIIEAALFISNGPLMLDELGKISGINSLGYVKEILESIQKYYEESGIEVVSTPEGWEMQVRTEILPKVAHLTPYSDLPEGCKRTLALIIYKEPVNQADIIKIQGNKAYTYIKKLVRTGLVRTEKEGRSKKIILTQEFERYFGEEKEKIKRQLAAAVESSKPRQDDDEPDEPGEHEERKSAKRQDKKKPGKENGPSEEELKKVFGEDNPNLMELDI